ADSPAPQPPLRILCPYCGHLQVGEVQCEQCRGLFEPLSRQATQNSMGPWQVRDASRAFAPGCSYDTLKQLIARGRVTSTSIVRGPTTRQFWRFAIDAPGVAVLLGRCHNCHIAVGPDDYMCKSCGEVLSPIAASDRQHLNLQPLQSFSDPTANTTTTPSRLIVNATPIATVASSVASTASMEPSAPADGQSYSRPQPHLSVGAEVPRSIAAELHIASAPATSITRALRQQNATLRTIIFALGALILALGAAVVFMLIDSPPQPLPTAISVPAAKDGIHETPSAGERANSPSPSETHDSSPQSSPTNSEESSINPAPIEAPLDPGLAAWSSDIARAVELAAQNTTNSLAKAVEALKLVQQQATAASNKPTSDFPKLTERIAEYESRLDRLQLRDLVNPGPPTGQSPPQ
ncbi:MAG TPA: hypothetical protein VG797_02180, partial [Phycisphaerales bacterium]|nr:hypothetical protein [Phycisphaerales bacterium]